MKKLLHNHFVPHVGNDYKPHILQKAALSSMVVLVMLSFTLANIQALVWISSDWMVSTILPAVIVAETNQERGLLAPLTPNSTLDQAAQLKAEHMAANEYFAHFAPDGTSPWYFFGQVDYGFVHAGENLAIHFSDSSEVVEAWMDSPTHRANIMNGDFREIGIGVAEGNYEGYKTLYVVQLFGTQAAAPLAVAAPEPLPVEIPAPQVAAAVLEVEPIPTPAPEPTELPVVEVEAVAGIEDAVTVVEAPREQESLETTVTEIVETELVPVVATETIPVLASESNDRASEFTDLISTTTGGVPASLNSVEQAGTSKPFMAFATQPQFVLQLLYAMIGMFVVGALMLATLIEIRRQHPVQIAYSLALLLLMYGLYQLHIGITSGATIV